MSDRFRVPDSVLKLVYRYGSHEQLLADRESKVIGPTDACATAFEKRLAALRHEYVPWQNKKE